MSVKENILIEFDMVVDLDLAMINFVKEHNSPLFNKDILSMNTANQIGMLLDRSTINPLEILVDSDTDVTDLYKELYDSKDLLKYANVCDMYGLMITYLKLAKCNITFLCFNQDQRNYLYDINPDLNIIVSTRENVNLSKYTTIYIKYYINALRYNNLNGKNLFTANARYNMEQGNNYLKIAVSSVVAYTNKVYTTDIYKNIKYIADEGE